MADLTIHYKKENREAYNRLTKDVSCRWFLSAIFASNDVVITLSMAYNDKHLSV